MPQATQTRRISISVDTQGSQQLKAIADQLGGLNKSTKSLAGTFAQLSATTVSFLGGLSIRELTSFSDEIQTLNNRLLAITGSQTQATELLGALAQAARDTNSSISQTSSIFGRLSLALQDANIDSSVMVDITKTLVNTFRLSGSTSEDAAEKVNSLAYALQQGGLKGRELRTVLRDNQVLGEALKKTFGGNLVEAANNGFITTSKLLQVLYTNMNDVNIRATLLTATFGESLTKVLDAFKVKLFELNQDLGASGSFVQAAQFMIDNMGTIEALLLSLGAATIPALVLQVAKLAAGFGLLSTPVIVVTGLAAALLSTNSALEQFLDPVDRINIAIYKLDVTIVSAVNHLLTWASYLPSAAGHLADAAKILTDMDLANSNQQIQTLTFKALALSDQVQSSGDKATASVQKWLAAIQGAKNIKEDKTPFQLLAALNAEFTSGAISVEEYNTKIQSVNLDAAHKQFATGHDDLAKLQVANDAFSTYNLNQQLKNGTISFQEYDDSIRNLKLDKLNQDLAAGRISLEQYNTSLAAVTNQFSTQGALRTGLQDYLNTIGTTTLQVAQGITTAFQSVETSLLSFIKTGKFNFDQFTQGILDDLLKIIIRAEIIQPLAQGLLGAITPTTLSNTQTTVPQGGPGNYIVQPNKYGNVYDMGLKRFANGGVVTSPTMFGYGSGNTGLMGEAGPEAIMPLSRASDGSLGVSASVNPVTINIINQANDTQVQQQQSTGPNGDKQIDILITSRVSSAISNGKFDKAFKSAYGMSRKGL